MPSDENTGKSEWQEPGLKKIRENESLAASHRPTGEMILPLRCFSNKVSKVVL